MKKKIMYKGKRMMKYIVMALVWFTITGCDSKTQQGDVNVSEPITQTPITDNGGSTQPITSTPDTISLDTIPPIITLNGDNNITVYKGENYQELGAIAYDDKDGYIDVKISGEVNTKSVGTYVITYRASDRAGNEANTTREVNVVVKSSEVMLEEMRTLLEDDSIPFTTEAEFNQTAYAKHHLSDEEGAKLERAHMLVATATDPDPEWFSTGNSRNVIIANAGENHTIQLNKLRDDGSIIGPVDNERLRLVVRIQKAKDDFEYVTNANVDQYAWWDGEGVLKIHVPDNLEKGRLIVGIRPNFDDVATTAIAERWSTYVMAEVWTTKAGVKNIDSSSVLFPIESNGGIGLSTESQFNKEVIKGKIQNMIDTGSSLILAMVIKNENLQKDEKVAYMFNNEPYAGRVIYVEDKGNQQLILLSPEIFDVYDVVDGDDDFMQKEGLLPEHVIYREGGKLQSDVNQSDPVRFEKERISPKVKIIKDFSSNIVQMELLYLHLK